MAEDADKTLPSMPLFLTQCSAEIRQHEQFMGQTALAKCTSPYAPTSRTSRKRERERRVFIRIQTNRKPELLSASSEQFVHWPPEQMFAGAIQQTQTPVGIESEHSDIDFGHDRAKQRCRFERPEPLHTQRFAKQINLEERLAKRIIFASTARANGIISLPQRCQEIGHRLQRTDKMRARAGDESYKTADDEDGQRPLHLGAVIARPENDKGDSGGRGNGSKSKPSQASLVRQAMSMFRRAVHLPAVVAGVSPARTKMSQPERLTLQFINRIVAVADRRRCDLARALRLLCAHCRHGARALFLLETLRL